jgi:dihydroneopterin aldolase
MTYVITLEEMEFRAYHGCYDIEKVVGNRFLVSLALEVELGEGVAEDNVDKVINYLSVYEVVAKEMGCKSNIMENVALRILDAIYMAFSQIVKATIIVSKLAPPLGGKVKKVSVTLSR